MGSIFTSDLGKCVRYIGGVIPPAPDFFLEILRTLLLVAERLSTIFFTIWVSILSRVAEGLGPMTPQQPVFLLGKMLVLPPTRSGRER